jgi:hypothetical protein
MDSGIDWPDPERESRRYGIEATVAEGVAAQQSPGGEQASPQDAKAVD